ncbi:MAG TPA: hypothetical protein VGM88_12330 [Kofleriaceae bacterium]
MRSIGSLVIITWSATLVFWGTFGACFEPPGDSSRTRDQLIAMWDPLTCGPPHRVVVELEDGAGNRINASAPCDIGELQADVPELGEYHGRAFAAELGQPIRSIEPVTVAIDRPTLKWAIPTPE